MKGGEKVMLKSKLMSLVTIGTLVMSAFAPSAFADVRISGNGSNSQNAVWFSQSNSANIQQRNNSTFTNNVGVWQNTGRNITSDNTGGDVSVRTGNASSQVDIQNIGGQNIADLSGLSCGCISGIGNIKISGNGSGSRNIVNERINNSLRVNQNSFTNANNRVNVNQNTGKNDTNNNTFGQGDPFVSTGDVTSNIMIHNLGGSNELQVN